MNPSLAKEVRLLRPSVIVGILIPVALAYFLTGSDAWGFVTWTSAAFSAFIGALSFGAEFEGRTMLSLLSQPISRQKIWFRKMGVLAVALILVNLACILGIAVFMRGEALPASFRDLAAIMVLATVIAFCSAPCITLAVKNTPGAVAFTVFLPPTLAGGFFFLCWAGSFLTSHPDVPIFQAQFERHAGLIILLACAGYSAITYALGYRSFMKLQVIDSQTQELALPTAIERALGRPAKKIIPGYTSPRASLIRKELQLHRVSFVGAVFITVLLAVESVAWLLHKSEATAMLMVVELIIYTLAIPVIIGIVSVAEERNWGTSGWQLTLPVSPFKQWIIKMNVAFATALFLSIGLPLLLLFLGSEVIGLPISYPAINTLRDLMLPACTLLGFVVFFCVILYASSVSISSLQAITFAGGLLVACGIIIGLENFSLEYAAQHWPSFGFLHSDQTHAALIAFAGNFSADPGRFMVYVDVTLIALWFICLQSLTGVFAYKNFRSGELDPRRTWAQTFIIAIAIVVPAFFVSGLVFITNNL